MIPYEPQFISKLLRGMAPEHLAAAHPRQFQTWPAPVTIPAETIGRLIRIERTKRGLA